MLRQFIAFPGILLFAFAATLPAQIPGRLTFAQLEQRASGLLPTRSQLHYQDIPWVHDLAEAQKIAQAENRPIFLWGYGGRGRPDNGLEGC